MVKKREQIEQQMIRNELNAMRKNRNKNKNVSRPNQNQIDFRKEIAHLGLRVSDNHVQNLVMPLYRVTKIFTPSTTQYEWMIDDNVLSIFKKKDNIKLFYKIG